MVETFDVQLHEVVGKTCSFIFKLSLISSIHIYLQSSTDLKQNLWNDDEYLTYFQSNLPLLSSPPPLHSASVTGF